MEKKETIDFMKRIKSHYQEFIIDEFKIKEWHKELNNYDAEDVNNKFDEHLKSEVYGEQIPKLYFLTKYLVPTKDKGKQVHYTVICQLCGQAMLDSSYDEHYKRCSAAMTIVKDMKKHFNLTIDYQQLLNMNEHEFDDLYVRYLNKMAEAKTSSLRKKIILKCLYSDVDMDINELIKNI